MIMRNMVRAFIVCALLCAPLHAQTMISVLLPRYIEGLNGTNANRIPFVYRAKVTGLAPREDYRYYNQIITSADTDSADGAGNCIFVSMTGDFVRTSGPGFKTTGTYGVFTADDAGEYEGWFINEPTGNAARFVPGKYVFMRIIMKNSAALTTPAIRRTSIDSVRVVRLTAGAGDAAGTGLRCTSTGRPKDFVFVYDNSAAAGRPISGTFIEEDGTANTTANSYAGFYSASVNDVRGAFGMVLPNALAGGIRVVEQRSLQTGIVVASASDADGVWPSGANTVNPSGGTTEIVLSSSDVQLTTHVEVTETGRGEYALEPNYPNPFNPATTVSYAVPTESVVTLEVVNMLGERIATLVNGRHAAGRHSVRFDAARLPSGIYFCRLSAGTFMCVQKMTVIR